MTVNACIDEQRRTRREHELAAVADDHAREDLAVGAERGLVEDGDVGVDDGAMVRVATGALVVGVRLADVAALLVGLRPGFFWLVAIAVPLATTNARIIAPVIILCLTSLVNFISNLLFVFHPTTCWTAATTEFL